MTAEVRRVAVLDANAEHVERMRGDGLLLDDLGEERGSGSTPVRIPPSRSGARVTKWERPRTWT
jgi:hypothetical protein